MRVPSRALLLALCAACTSSPQSRSGAESVPTPVAVDSTGRSFYPEHEVDVPVELARNNLSAVPRYPTHLQDRFPTAEVIAEYDARGRVDLETFRVVRSTHVDFTNSVQKALEKLRSKPAVKDGRAVPQLITRSFGFNHVHAR